MSTITTADPHADQATAPDADPDGHSPRSLGSYIDPDTGETREIVELLRPDRSRFVVDYHRSALGDGRVLAHLSPEEAPENAGIVCELYLAEETKSRCRLLSAEDLARTRWPTPARPDREEHATQPEVLCDAQGYQYRIHQLKGERSPAELRWTRSTRPDHDEPFEVLTLREVVAHLDDYEPVRTITAQTVALHRDAGDISVRRLSEESERLAESRILLNRALREHVQRTVAHGDLSMSEIALRCGRLKRSGHGSLRGDTSWLARRIGLLPEGGDLEPCRWIHSDVLALIARDGLGICPHEVEL